MSFDEQNSQDYAAVQQRSRNGSGTIQAVEQAVEALKWFDGAEVGHTGRLRDEGEAESVIRTAQRRLESALVSLANERERPQSANNGMA